MIEFLSGELREQYQKFLDFAKLNIEPFANQWEKDEKIPAEVIEQCAQEGFLGCMVPKEYGGNEWDVMTYGAFNEAMARASVSLSGLFNVHTMVLQTLLKWGTEEQKNKWLPRMTKGEIIGAFALTEPEAGSDIKRVESVFTRKGDKLILNGKKRWITFGGLADLFLVFGMLDGKPTAAIVEKVNPGVQVIPINNMLGFKASQLAVLEFHDCEVSEDDLVARPGFAFSHVAPYALEYGRISVAFAGLGIIRACLEICSNHTLERRTFNSLLIEHGAIREMLTNMGVDHEAASMLCINACKAKDAHSSDATEKVMIAKYFASRAAAVHSNNAVQITGAVGCNENYPVARLYRDAKVLEIIEGSTQIHQMILGKGFARKNRKRRSKKD